MAFTYKVLKPCFIDGTLREPGGKHDPYVAEEKLDPCPSALELVDGKVQKPRRRAAKAGADAAPVPGKVTPKTEPVRFEE